MCHGSGYYHSVIFLESSSTVRLILSKFVQELFYILDNKEVQKL